MRLLVVLALAAGVLAVATYEARAEETKISIGDGTETQINDREYSKQQREMEKQKQEILKNRNEENKNTQGGKPPQTASGAPPSGGPENHNDEKKTEKEKEEDDHKTVIKREVPEEDEHRKTGSKQHVVNLGQPVKQGCSASRFGVCPH